MQGALCTQKLDIARRLVKGKFRAKTIRAVRSLFLPECPGPGSGWGNLTALPASKDAVSPSHIFCSVLFCPGGGGWG